jgi:hypothetical protein
VRELDKEKIITTFRRCQKEGERVLYLEAAEMTGWILADAEKKGFTRPQAIEMAKQHLLGMGAALTDFASNHLESACKSIRPRLKEVKP